MRYATAEINLPQNIDCDLYFVTKRESKHFVLEGGLSLARSTANLSVISHLMSLKL